jgi:hypothetical protein
MAACQPRDTWTRGLGGSYGGASTAGGYTIGFVTGSVGAYDRLDALENTLRDCLGLPPVPGTEGALPA